MKETQPLTLAELEQRSRKLEAGLRKIDHVLATIGTPEWGGPDGKSGPVLVNLKGEEFLDWAVRIGKTKKNLQENAQPELLSRQKVVDDQIGIQEARKHVAEIRDLADAGFLPEEVLERAKKVLGQIERGKNPMVEILVDIDQREVLIEGGKKTKKFRSEIPWRIFLRLAEDAPNQVAGREIVKAAREAGSSAKYPSTNVEWLRKILGNPELVVLSGPGPRPEYRLDAKVLYVSQEKKGKTEEKKPLKPEDVTFEHFESCKLAHRLSEAPLAIVGISREPSVRIWQEFVQSNVQIGPDHCEKALAALEAKLLALSLSPATHMERFKDDVPVSEMLLVLQGTDPSKREELIRTVLYPEKKTYQFRTGEPISSVI